MTGTTGLEATLREEGRGQTALLWPVLNDADGGSETSLDCETAVSPNYLTTQ